jgi:hypothetical protein
MHAIDVNRGQIESRFRKAWACGGPRIVTPLGHGRYRVAGERGATYSVTLQGWRFGACSCPAGTHGRVCYHFAAALLRRTADEGMVAR